MMQNRWACPTCKAAWKDHSGISARAEACPKCGQKFPDSTQFLDLCASQDKVNIATEAAYKMYSKYYAPVALLAYWIIWRGNFLRHVKFFREILAKSPRIVDLATGDGSLTSLALFGSRKSRPQSVLAMDISGEMLKKAKKKLRDPAVTFVRADVCQLPFLSQSLDAISCFGGFNSFPSGDQALVEMARCLSRKGILRGSVLLVPDTNWRRKLVESWIKKGYQTEVVDIPKFKSWVRKAGLIPSHLERHGDVLLFELCHPSQAVAS